MGIEGGKEKRKQLFLPKPCTHCPWCRLFLLDWIILISISTEAVFSEQQTFEGRLQNEVSNLVY
jgi:hypothetical protein